ncbi:MAG: hypothetical protein IJF65_02630 [Clostridia bacterium]|nr:hypothetical protein [Clostridia bacterium]
MPISCLSLLGGYHAIISPSGLPKALEEYELSDPPGRCAWRKNKTTGKMPVVLSLRVSATL